ncbi:MAG TPA: alpha/beta hydrolase [Candidatus Binataceae bacterium]|nr:alpha/beta hydrolase [Candidatus Binataceae bacterium]
MKQRNFQMIKTNGVTLRTVVEGSGPLVILLHGFPQCWYLWRHQIDPLVAAGFQVAVPDQRGYGGSDKPATIEAYNIVELSNDVAGLASALGHERFIVVGHDWGAPVAWHTALLHARRVRAVVGMSVPYVRGQAGTMTRQENFGDNFWYIVYFQKPGVAEAELETDVRKSLRMMYYSISGDAPEGLWMQPKKATAKLLDGLLDPPTLPSWLTAEDLDYYVAQFEKSGFRGPINWYRNIDRNIEITPQLEQAKIEMPAYFIAGKRDIVLSFAGGMLLAAMEPYVPDLRGKVIIDGAGHWVQAERPAETNQALLGFLKSIS